MVGTKIPADSQRGRKLAGAIFSAGTSLPGTTPNFLNTSEFAFSRAGITGSKYFKLALTIRIYSFLNSCSSVYTKNGNPKSIEYTQRKNA